MGNTWVVVAIILVGFSLAYFLWTRGEAAAAPKGSARKAAKPGAGAGGKPAAGAADAAPGKGAGAEARSSAPPSEPQPSSHRRAVPSMTDDDEDGEDDNDITIVTLTPRLDLLAAAEGRLPDASSGGADDDDEDRLPDSTRASAVPIIYDEDAAEDEPTRAHAVILVSAVGQTDRGQKRKINEDRYLVLDDHQLYVVADGMGGHAGGEVASQCAVDTIAEAFKSNKFDGTPYEDVPRRGSELALAIQMANRAIYEKSKREPKLTGMGTTIVSARFTPGKQRVYLGHVGDSRCYRFRAGQLTQITTDHTMAAAGMTGPFAEHLSRAVGIAPAVKVDLVIVKPRHEDVFLLCSDGLSKMVKDDAIREVLAEYADPNEAAKVLVERANASGGRDNITVILVVVKDPKGFARYMQMFERKRKAAVAAVVVDGAVPASGEPASAGGEAVGVVAADVKAVAGEATAASADVKPVAGEATAGSAEVKAVAGEATAASADVKAVASEATAASAEVKAVAGEATAASADVKAVASEAKPAAPASRPSMPPPRPSVPPPRPSVPPPRASVPPPRPSAPDAARPSTPEARPSTPEARPSTPEARPSTPETARPSAPEARPSVPEARPSTPEGKGNGPLARPKKKS